MTSLNTIIKSYPILKRAKHLNRQFTEYDIQMANNYMKKKVQYHYLLGKCKLKLQTTVAKKQTKK